MTRARCPIGTANRSTTRRSPRGPGGGRAGGFSLIELVIVVTIIAIISAIALRRVSRHAEQSATNAAASDISVMQIAIERYRAEHGNYPSATNIADQLTKYTDGFGNVSPTRVAPYIYGGY